MALGKPQTIALCRQVANEHLADFAEEATILLHRLAAWEAHADWKCAEGWSVFRQLGLLRQQVGEPLAGNVESEVLEKITAPG